MNESANFEMWGVVVVVEVHVEIGGGLSFLAARRKRGSGGGFGFGSLLGGARWSWGAMWPCCYVSLCDLNTFWFCNFHGFLFFPLEIHESGDPFHKVSLRKEK